MERSLPPDQAWREIETLAHALTVLYPQPAALIEFASIVTNRVPVAQKAFDAFLVAQMRVSGVGTICTLDVKGFSGYKGITPESPESILIRLGL